MEDEATQSPDGQHWDVFICYRQTDGKVTAEWLYDRLENRPLPVAMSRPPRIRCYLDRRAAAGSNWRILNAAALQKARAMIVVCTTGASKENTRSPDEVWLEIRWWIANRKTAPILIDLYGEETRWVPDPIHERWPDAQLVFVDVAEWEKKDKAERDKLAEFAVSSITNGIVLSEGQVRDEELAEAVRLGKELKVALAEAETQRKLATAALLAARGELLIDEGGLSTAQCGALLVSECLHHAPKTLQGHRALAKAIAFFPPQIESAPLPPANGVAALSIAPAKKVVAVGSANQTIVIDVATQSRYWFNHKGNVHAVAVDPSGQYLATRAQGETVRLWNLDTKDLLHEWPDNKQAMSLLFGNSSRPLASCDRSTSKAIRIWDPVLRREDGSLHAFDSVYFLGAFSSDDKYLAAAVDHGQLEEDVAVAWQLEGPWREPGPRRGPSIGGYLKGGLKGVAFSRDGALIATTGFDHLVEVRPFAPDSGISGPLALARLRGEVGQAIAFDPNGGRVAIATEHRVRLWDFRSEREAGTIPHRDVLSLAFDTSGDTLMTVSNQEARLWDVTRGRRMARKVQETRKALDAGEIMEMIGPMRGRIERELTEEERAEYLRPENVE